MPAKTGVTKQLNIFLEKYTGKKGSYYPLIKMVVRKLGYSYEYFHFTLVSLMGQNKPVAIALLMSVLKSYENQEKFPSVYKIQTRDDFLTNGIKVEELPEYMLTEEELRVRNKFDPEEIIDRDSINKFKDYIKAVRYEGKDES